MLHPWHAQATFQSSGPADATAGPSQPLSAGLCLHNQYTPVGTCQHDSQNDKNSKALYACYCCCALQCMPTCCQAIAPASHTATASTSTLCKVLTWHLGHTWQDAAAAGAQPRLMHQADWLAYLLHGAC